MRNISGEPQWMIASRISWSSWFIAGAGPARGGRRRACASRPGRRAARGGDRRPGPEKARAARDRRVGGSEIAGGGADARSDGPEARAHLASVALAASVVAAHRVRSAEESAGDARRAIARAEDGAPGFAARIWSSSPPASEYRRDAQPFDA